MLLAGGVDVEPRHWDPGDGSASAGEVDPARDAIELDLVARAWVRRLPILGLCRGAQLLAVSRGGRLCSDIATECGGDPTDHQHGTAKDDGVRHRVDVHARSRLARIVGAVRVEVNSRHHQAVRVPGDGLVAVAHDPDTRMPEGLLVEAIEALDPSRWVVGVQWHPENLVHRIDAAGVAAFRLFAHFVRAAKIAARGDGALGERAETATNSAVFALLDRVEAPLAVVDARVEPIVAQSAELHHRGQ